MPSEKPQSGPKIYKSAKEANTAVGSIRELIGFSRLKILTTTESGFLVEYDGKELEVAKDEESKLAGSAPSSIGMRLEQKQELIILPEYGIFQDQTAPDEFKEAMIFHEMREAEYKEAGFEDAHGRALRDEIMYALQHFEGGKQNRYFEWVKIYRKKTLASDLSKIRDEYWQTRRSWYSDDNRSRQGWRNFNDSYTKKIKEKMRQGDFEDVMVALKANPPRDLGPEEKRVTSWDEVVRILKDYDHCDTLVEIWIAQLEGGKVDVREDGEWLRFYFWETKDGVLKNTSMLHTKKVGKVIDEM